MTCSSQVAIGYHAHQEYRTAAYGKADSYHPVTDSVYQLRQK
jgi:hypothetical protein